MVSYAADSHQLYGALYHTPAGRYKTGAMLPVYEWDTGRYLTDIPQVATTYSTVGNMNEHSLIIGETTYGGRSELADPTGKIDYGSLIYITLQRAKTAREAIATIADLTATSRPTPTRRASPPSRSMIPRTASTPPTSSRSPAKRATSTVRTPSSPSPTPTPPSTSAACAAARRACGPSSAP